MKQFERIGEDLYRLTIPYKDIYTTVYLLREKGEAVLFDAASYDEDADEVIVPALKDLGVTGDALKYVFISHNHGDHAGGLARLLAHYPTATIVSRSPKLCEKYEGYSFLFPEEGQMLLGAFRVVPIVGHTEDSAALLDTRAGTLITGDCLQGYGLVGSGDWAANINFPAEHLKALERLEKMPLSAIYAAHDYLPYGYRAVGRESVKRYIEACREALFEIKEMILSAPNEDDAAIRARYNAREKSPTLRETVVQAVRAAIQDGQI